MSPQKIASAVGMAGVAALLAGVGLPAILPPPPVPPIEIVVPAGARDEVEPTVSPEVIPPGRVDDDDDDDDDDGGLSDDDGFGDDDSPAPDSPDDPDDSPDDSPDDD